MKFISGFSLKNMNVVTKWRDTFFNYMRKFMTKQKRHSHNIGRLQDFICGHYLYVINFAFFHTGEMLLVLMIHTAILAQDSR